MKYTDFLKTIKTCPFCARPTDEILLESEKAFVTYAIAPYHKHHLLVIPKRHFSSFIEITTEEMSEIDILQRKALDILHNLGYKNVSFLVRDGDGSGKSIEHLHYHVIPDVFLGDMGHSIADRPVMTETECLESFEDLKNALSSLDKKL